MKSQDEFKKESRKLIKNLLSFSKNMRIVAKETKKVEKALRCEKKIEFDIKLN